MEGSAGTRPRSGDVPAAVAGRKVDEGGLILVLGDPARSARLRVSSASDRSWITVGSSSWLTLTDRARRSA